MSSKRKTYKQVKVPENIEQPLTHEFKPKTRNQSEYVKAVLKNDVTICVGPAGTGKSAVAVGLAVAYLYHKKAEKIVISRPVVEASFKSIGALPGDIREKLNPHVRPVYEELVSYLGKPRVERMIKEEIIEICPVEMMRGRTFTNSIMVLDEAQNAMFEQLVMFSTRLGLGSKAIINGDLKQSDLPYQYLGGFDDFIDIMSEVDGVAIVELDKSDNQRHPTVRNIIDALERYHDSRIQAAGN